MEGISILTADQVKDVQTIIQQMLAPGAGDKKISQLDAIPSVADADLAAIVDATDATTKKATALQFKDYVNAGKPGGKTIVGGTASGEDLILVSTSHGTKGDVIVKDGALVLNNDSPDYIFCERETVGDGPNLTITAAAGLPSGAEARAGGNLSLNSGSGINVGSTDGEILFGIGASLVGKFDLNGKFELTTGTGVNEIITSISAASTDDTIPTGAAVWAAIAVENLWNRAGTELTPTNADDDVDMKKGKTIYGDGTDTMYTFLEYNNASTTKPVVKWSSTIGGLGHYHGLHLEVQESGKAVGLHTESYTAAAYNILSTRNVNFTVQDFIGYMSTGQLQSGTRHLWARQFDAPSGDLIYQSINDAVLTNRFKLDFATGLLSVGTTNYETLVLADNDIPNRKFVMDAVATVDTWDEVMHLGSSFTIADTENLSATITQNDTTNNPPALVIANTGSGNDITLPNININGFVISADTGVLTLSVTSGNILNQADGNFGVDVDGDITLDTSAGDVNFIIPNGSIKFNDEVSTFFTTSEFQIFKNSAPDVSLWSSSAVASEDANLNLVRSRGTIGTPTIVADNDLIGNINFIGYDGGAFRNGAEIRGEMNGTPSTGVLPCDLVFYVNAGAGVATEGMRLVKDKSLKIDKINELTGAAGVTIDSVLCKDGALVLPMNANIGAIVIESRPDGHQNGLIMHKASSTKNSLLAWYDDTLANYTWYIGEWGSHDLRIMDRVGSNDAIIVKSNTAEVLLPLVYGDTVSTSPEVLHIQSDGQLGKSTTATPTFGGLTVAADTDVTVALGNAKLGSPVSDIMYLSHYDTNNATDYAIKQLASGRTCLNSKSGTQTDICVNNVAQVNVDATKTTLTNYLNQQGIFAEIYVADASAAQSIATGAGYTKSTAFTTDGQSANCTAAAASDKITITQTGIYRVSGSCSGTSGKANLTWRGAAFLNGVEQNQVHFKRKFTTTTDSGDMGFTGFIDVTSVPWDLDFRLRHDDGANQNFTIEYANLNVEYMGAT
jgi:hypothetical protein